MNSVGKKKKNKPPLQEEQPINQQNLVLDVFNYVINNQAFRTTLDTDWQILNEYLTIISAITQSCLNKTDLF